MHDWISSSIIDTQNNTLFDERLPGSNASCPNRLVGRKLVCDLVHLLDHSLVAVIESND
jgi:hypothetical protein